MVAAAAEMFKSSGISILCRLKTGEKSEKSKNKSCGLLFTMKLKKPEWGLKGVKITITTMCIFSGPKRMVLFKQKNLRKYQLNKKVMYTF